MSMVVNEIVRQIGHKALYMLGAKDLQAGLNSVSFKIRGSGRVTNIRIKYLEGPDLYKICFYKIYNNNIKVVAEHEEIYDDMLHEIIRTETGLATSL